MLFLSLSLQSYICTYFAVHFMVNLEKTEVEK